MVEVVLRSSVSIECLSPEAVSRHWRQLEPLFAEACKGNPIARRELTPDYFWYRTQNIVDDASIIVFAGFEGTTIACMIAIEFSVANGHKTASVAALAGKHLIKFKSLYWQSIIDWLKANGVEFLDAYVATEHRAMYEKKFGFTESCSYVRMVL